MSRRSPWLAAGVGVALAASSVAPVAAESAIWTLVATPLTATTGSPVTYTLTATNTDPLAAVLSSNEIGCLHVDVPGNFVVHGAAVTGASTGASWSATVVANRVGVRTSSGGDRLATLDWVRFTVTATAASTGSPAWSSRAFRDQDCGGSGALLAVPPIVVVTGPAVTPTPVPTPTPTPVPTPTGAATPRPTPRPTTAPSATPRPPDGTLAPDPSPSPISGATPRPDAPAPTLRPEGARSPAASAEVAATPAPPGGGGEDPEGEAVAPANPSDPDAPLRALDEEAGQAAGVELGLGPLGLLGGIDVWLVPGAILALPGVGVIAFVLLQGAGALAWLPAIRRLRDDERAAAR
jgi:hypothetical protein